MDKTESEIKNMLEVSVVVPVFNESENIDEFLRQVVPILELNTQSYEIIFAVDPSTDGTFECISESRNMNENIKIILFSRRFGQPMAILGGLDFCTGRSAIVMDVDLQDPPELIPEMLLKWRNGFDVVYATRKKRLGETFLKTLISKLGYWVINRFGDVSIPRNTGDFRLMDRRVLDQLKRFGESHGFLRGLVALVGFSQTEVFFDRPARHAGKGNYNRWLGSLRIGFNGIVGFSSALLNLSTGLGFFSAFCAIVFGFLYLLLQLIGANFPVGNPTLVFLLLLMGGLQLICLGIVGQYIGRIYDEVKKRPRYIIDRLVGLVVPRE